MHVVPEIKPSPAANGEALKAYADGMGFRLVQPQMPFPNGMLPASVLQACSRYGLCFDVYNAVVLDCDFQTGAELGKLCRIARASTYAVARIINKAVSLLAEDEAFLNVGVWQGFTFLAGLIGNPDKRCIGVDNFSTNLKVDSDGKPSFRGLSKLAYILNDRVARRAFYRNYERYRSPRHEFHEMDYVEYLRNVHQGAIGFYIYDAQHRYRDQYRGLELAEPYFTDNCVILIDDTNAADNRQATFDFMEHSQHDYEVLFDQRTAGNRHPTFWNGVMVFQRVG